MQRDNILDIFKGLAIMAIVECHAAWVLPVSGMEIAEFTLSYSVVGFVFAAGYLFKGISDSRQLYSAIGRRFVKLWYLYFAYSAAMLLLNPVLLRLQILGEADRVWVQRGFYQALIMQDEQRLIYPMWFVPMFLITSCLFTGAFAFAERQKHKLLWHCAMVLVCALAGFYAQTIEFYPPYYADASLLCVPIMYLGYIAGRHKEKLDHILNWWGTIIAAAFVLWVVMQDLGSIELSSHKIISPVLFYPTAFAGIYMAMSASRLIARIPKLSGMLACAGRNSFHIMALHLFVFKIIDALWGRIQGINPAVYQQFPAAFDFWPVYTILGTAIPIALAETGRRILARLKARNLVHQ